MKASNDVEIVMTYCVRALVAALAFACLVALGPEARASGGSLVVGALPPGQVLQYDSRSGRFLATLVPVGGANAGACCVAYGPDEHLYVTSPLTNEVGRYHGVTGEFIDIFVPAGSGGLVLPVVLAFGPDGHLYVGSNGNHAVLRYDGRTGAFIDAFVPPGSGGMAGYDPQLFTWGPDGHFYVASPFANQGILRFHGTTGAFIGKFTAAVPGYDGDGGLLFKDGYLYSASYSFNGVLRFDATTGAFVDVLVTSGSGGLNGPVGMRFGPDGHLYVAGGDSNNIIRYDGLTGAFRDVFVEPLVGGLQGPRDFVFKETTRVCHRAPGSTGPGRTLVVPHRAAQGHLAQGDKLGPC
jgi:streptogramin lyase